MSAPPRIDWPGGCRFAFTIFDDTDKATVANTAPLYDLLEALGMRITKSVWPLAVPDGVRRTVGGDSCADPEYLAWVRGLQARGHEIAFHDATDTSSPRERIVLALDRFRTWFGHDPHTYATHAGNREGMYFGADRLSGTRRALYRLATRDKWRGRFTGHVEGDPHFWGDVCRARIRYVRNFVYRDVDTLAACPWMPYHDPARPYVQRWFASSEGPTPAPFLALLAPANVRRLVAQGGACIVYTHLGAGFGTEPVRSQVLRTLEHIARQGGWFVPVATLLDFLRDRQAGDGTIDPAARARLERRWLVQKLAQGRTS